VKVEESDNDKNSEKPENNGPDDPIWRTPTTPTTAAIMIQMNTCGSEIVIDTSLLKDSRSK
jgi:hypothetical protein